MSATVSEHIDLDCSGLLRREFVMTRRYPIA